MANTLAQNHQTLLLLEFKHANLYNPNFYIVWENTTIEQSARKLIKTICNAHILAMWSSQNRNQQWAHLYDEIDWNSTWLYINNNNKRSSKFTNFKLSKLKTFRIKLLHNELPTPSHLHKYYTNTISNNKCFKCNQTDLELHWITNHYTNILQEIILQSVIETLNNTNLEITQSQFLILKNLIIHHPSLQLSTNSFNTINLYTSLKGLLLHSLTQTIQLYTNSVYSASQITIKLFLKLNSKIYEQICYPIVLNSQTGSNNIIFIYHTQTLNKISEIADNSLIYLRTIITYIVLLSNTTKLHQLNSLFKNFPLGQYIGLNMAFLQTIFFLIKSR